MSSGTKERHAKYTVHLAKIKPLRHHNHSRLTRQHSPDIVEQLFLFSIRCYMVAWRKGTLSARWTVYLECLSFVPEDVCTPLILYAVTENEVKTGALDLHYRP